MHKEITHRNLSGIELSNEGTTKMNEIVSSYSESTKGLEMKQLLAHLNSLFSLAFPLIANALITEAQFMITMSYIGRIGTLEMGAYVLGNMLCNISGYSIGFGACSALDTLISQAYGGKAYELVGLHALRAIVILSLFTIPVGLIWASSAYILQHALLIDEATAQLAGTWSMAILPGLWPQLMFQILQRYLQGCGIVWPSIVANVVCASMNIGGNYLFIEVLHWGFKGAALAMVLSQWSSLITMCIMIWAQIIYDRKYLLPYQSIPVSTLDDDLDSDIENPLSISPVAIHESLSVSSIDSYEHKTSHSMKGCTGSHEPAGSSDESSHSRGRELGEKYECDDLDVDAAGLIPLIAINSNDDDFIRIQSPVLFAATGRSCDAESYMLQTDRPFSLSLTIPLMPMSKLCQNWSTFLVLAAPGAASLFLEWGSFELMAGLAGQLGDVSLATHGVYMSTCALLYMIPQSLAGATATLAGNHLGDNKAAEAKFVVWLGIVVTTSWGILLGLLLFLVLRPFWGSIFTTDPNVLAAVYDFMPIMFLYTIVDATKCISLNILRSTGRPGVTAVGNIVSCVFVMLPLGYLFSIVKQYDLYGIWGAMSLGWAIATVLYLACIFTTNWEEQSGLASERNLASDEKIRKT